MEEPTNRQDTAPPEASEKQSRRRRRCDNCNARLRGRFCIRCGQRDLEYDRVVCDNCGAEKLGHYCAVCGQSDRDFRRNVFPVVGEVLSEAFEIDSRLLKTAPKLLFRPGFLSLEFTRNRRASYLSPFRLYLFTSIVFFFVLSLTIDLPEEAGPGHAVIQSGDGSAPITLGRPEEQRPLLRFSFDEDADDEDDDREDGPVSPVQSDSDEISDTAAKGAEAEPGAPGRIVSAAEERPTPGLTPDSLTAEQRDAFDRLSPALDQERRRKLREILRRSGLSEAVVQGARKVSARDAAGVDTTQRYVVGQLVDIIHRPWDAVRTWFEALPVAMFCLLPLFALMLKLFYAGSGRFYSEHLVFAMHNHTVAFLAFTLIALIPEGHVAAGASVQAILLALALYYFVAMRRFFGGGRFGTAIKFLLLVNLYGFLLLAALAGAAAAVLLLF